MAAARPLRLPIVPEQAPRPKLRLVKAPLEEDQLARHVAIRAMARFRCIGSACEASCCQDWSVAVDRPAYDRMARVLDEGTFAAAIERVAQPEPGAAFATIKLNASGECLFFDEAKLCSLQVEHGEEILTDACASFPRAALTIEGRRETTGRLSCPEVGRLALLADDGTELADAGGADGSRPLVGKRVEGVAAASFDDVRDAILAILGRHDMPISDRVAIIADLAERVAPFADRGNDANRGPGRASALARLDHELRRVRDAAFVADVRTRFAALAIPWAAAANVVASAVLERMRISINPAFDALGTAVIASFRDALPEMTATALGELWAKRQGTLDERYGSVLERILQNWSRLFWLQSPHTDSPSLLAHTIRFTLCLAIVRFLLAGHPRVVALLADEAPDAPSELESAAIEVARLFSRAFEHDPKFLDAIDETLRASGPHTLVRALVFARAV